MKLFRYPLRELGARHGPSACPIAKAASDVQKLRWPRSPHAPVTVELPLSYRISARQKKRLAGTDTLVQCRVATGHHPRERIVPPCFQAAAKRTVCGY